LKAIIVRFMEISLGYVRIQVNTQCRVNDGKGLGAVVTPPHYCLGELGERFE